MLSTTRVARLLAITETYFQNFSLKSNVYFCAVCGRLIRLLLEVENSWDSWRNLEVVINTCLDYVGLLTQPDSGLVGV